MAKYLREKPSNFKFSLHDAKIIDIDYDYGENRLIFKTQSGFIDIERNEMADGEIILEGVSWDDSYVYIMEYKNVLTGNVGSFVGEKMYLSNFVDAFYSKFGSFDVMSEYDSYMTFMLSGFLKRGSEELEANIEIFYNGDIIYNVRG
ncbi:hypothetical protein [uncultured Peptoniphilus sp.]|uniref:hypothetical protein n=1 Tax=uncultured Peptoniphilus sp. TaxID=254354 RepID=UPI002806071F|nr:hypothetical protein [uncultured Peptoniphilus sp.]